MAAVKAKTVGYDFAQDGGAISTIELTRWSGGQELSGPSGGTIPAGSIPLCAIVRITENVVVSGAGTAKVVVAGLTITADLDGKVAGDAVYMAAPAAGAVTPYAADDNPQLLIEVAAVTAGKIEVTVLYFRT